MNPVDFYCERIAAGFGGEPVNALTALAFLAVGLWRLRAAPDEADAHAAFALMLVGIAACLHHLFALTVTLSADIWANILYLAAFGALLLRRLAGLGALAILASLAFVVALKEGLELPQVRAAAGYWGDMFAVEALILAGLAVGLMRRAPDTARGLALGAIVLAAGLPFRFLDSASCGTLPFGTHGIWHLFNAASSAIVLVALARHHEARRRAG